MGHFPQFKNQQDAYPVSNQKLENKDERGIKVIDVKYYKQKNILSGQRNFILTFHNEPDTRALITKMEMFVWTLDFRRYQKLVS